MSPYQKLVNEFMTTAGQDVNSNFCLYSLDDSLVNFRISLIEEELEELKEGIKNNDKIEIADALADLLYVIYGTASTFGVNLEKSSIFFDIQDSQDFFLKELESVLLRLKNYNDDRINLEKAKKYLKILIDNVFKFSYHFGIEINDVFQEVHSSNMSKFCLTKKEAQDSVENYSKKEKENFAHFKKKGKYYVILRTSDDKVLKGVNYFKPNIESIFVNHDQNPKFNWF